MKIYLSIFLLLSLLSAKTQDQQILIDYSYQIPIGSLSEDFGHNSSIGMSYMILKNNIITGVEGSFMFGNNIKNEDILSNITTNEGFLINSSGELNQVIFYQRGFNSHILFGKKLKKDPNKLTGLYIYGGLGYIDHKIRIEADRSHLPQINDDYIKGYDNYSRGVSTKLYVNYMYLDKRKYATYNFGINFINAFIKNQRPYSFNEMSPNNQDWKLNQLIGMTIGVIIPINRKNEEKFHYF